MSLIHASEEQVAKVGGKEMFARLLFWTKQITAKQNDSHTAKQGQHQTKKQRKTLVISHY